MEKEVGVLERARRPLSYMYSFMALIWFALAVSWFGQSEWTHAAIDFAAGSFCWFMSEQMRDS